MTSEENIDSSPMDVGIPHSKPDVKFQLVQWSESLGPIPPECLLTDEDKRSLASGTHADPFSVLGPHVRTFNLKGEVAWVISYRLWVKDAKQISVSLASASPQKEALKAESKSLSEVARWLFEGFFVLSASDSDEADSSSLAAESSDGIINLQRFNSPEAHTAIVQNKIETTNQSGVDSKRLSCPRLRYVCQVQYHNDASNKAYDYYDPYMYGLVASSYDLDLFCQGSCWHVDDLMGSHVITLDDIQGVRFLLWAPNAVNVSLVGDFCQWEKSALPMRKRHDHGVWELFVPHAQIGHKYGYAIYRKDRTWDVKIDPFAQEFEVPPQYASIISSCDDAYKTLEERYQWRDSEWIAERSTLDIDGKLHKMPVSIYEVHLPSWMRGEGNSYLGYRELAPRLISHVSMLNFTHVEFMPLCHFPFEGSWGYQVSGQYAVYSKLGNPDDFKYLVDELHLHGIGVIMDVVLAHFVKDSWGLVKYDGEALFEYADPREAEIYHWGTLLFNFRRNEVRSFLLGSAYRWLRAYHVDGLRVDAVSAMLYKNYCRDDWIPNEKGGDANLQAISLLQELTWAAKQQTPGVILVAEESTAWGGVTSREGGLGFDLKWDLGWMNDSLSYLCMPLEKRPQGHSKLTFRGLYISNEKWALPLSHDEVVSGKGSLLDKCGYSGTPFEVRLATLRSLIGMQVCMPGRPLLFMGSEFGQGREWNYTQSLDWHEAKEDARSKTMTWVSDVLAVYKHHTALHCGDDEGWNFEWSDCDNKNDCIIAWIRKYEHWWNDVLIVCNFSDKPYTRYPFGVRQGPKWHCLLSSDDPRYAGLGRGVTNLAVRQASKTGKFGFPYCLYVDIPPFSCLIFGLVHPTEQEKKEHYKSKAVKLEQTKTSTDTQTKALLADPKAAKVQ